MTFEVPVCILFLPRVLRPSLIVHHRIRQRLRPCMDGLAEKARGKAFSRTRRRRGPDLLRWVWFLALNLLSTDFLRVSLIREPEMQDWLTQPKPEMKVNYQITLEMRGAIDRYVAFLLVKIRGYEPLPGFTSTTTAVSFKAVLSRAQRPRCESLNSISRQPASDFSMLARR